MSDQLHVVANIKLISGRQNEDFMSSLPQMMRQLTNVPLNATRRIPAIWTYLNYPHAVAVRVMLRWPCVNESVMCDRPLGA